MNDLNAQQVVLLTLLVSFVTSIATGITTVSLLEQAPEPVTQTINRVIERTVERVAPSDTDGKSNISVQNTKEKEIITVVTKAEDLTIDSVSKNSSSLVRLYNVVGGVENFIGLGIVIDNQGRVVTDAVNIRKEKAYVGVYKNGKFNLDVSYRELNSPFAILKVKQGGATDGFTSASFADSQNIKLAQSVISLSGKVSPTVSAGIVTGLETESGVLGENDVNSTTEPAKPIKLITTSVDANNVLTGSILLNLSGEIVGARINIDPARPTSFLPSNSIKEFLVGK